MNSYLFDRKRFGIIVIIIGLMLIMFATAKRIDGNLKYVALMQSDINSLKEYDILGEKISYRLPGNWKTKLGTKLTKDILYHNDFDSEDAIINGSVEVWNWSSKEDVKTYLEKNKDSNLGENIYKNYKVNNTTINNYEAYEVIYTIMTSKNIYYRAYEYFVKENENKYIKFSFYVRDGNFRENMPTIFRTITETFKCNDEKVPN